MDIVKKPNMVGDGAAATPDNNKAYKGVRLRKWGKWVSEIRLPNSRERIWLGSYDSPEKAARAFDAALYCLRGCRANFNFPDTPFNLDISVNHSLTPQEIQEIAARFANEEPGHHHDNQEEPSQLSSQRGDNSSSYAESKAVSESSTYAATTNTNTASSSSTMYECDRTVQVDNGDMMISEMDWTFLKELGNSSESPVGSDYGLYCELDKIHSGELLYSTLPPVPPFEDNVDLIEGDEYDDPFSHQSFLWNWNF